MGQFKFKMNLVRAFCIFFLLSMLLSLCSLSLSQLSVKSAQSPLFFLVPWPVSADVCPFVSDLLSLSCYRLAEQLL